MGTSTKWLRFHFNLIAAAKATKKNSVIIFSVIKKTITDFLITLLLFIFLLLKKQ
jgi:hypothetical protein